MEDTYFETQRKAGDAAVWYNFKHQYDEGFKPVAVVHGANDDFLVIEEWEMKEAEIPLLELPKDYSAMTYPHIQSIKSDFEPLQHWEKIMGTIATMQNDHLRFILECKVPLNQIIKYHLASQGLNKKGQWIGFDQAERYWFGTNY